MINSINSIRPLDARRFDGLKPQIPKTEEDKLESSKILLNSKEQEQETKTISEKTEELRDKKKEDPFSGRELTEFEEKINNVMEEENLKIEFSKDEETQRMILKLIDKETQEVVHQYPPEITLKIARIVASTLEQGSLTNVKI